MKLYKFNRDFGRMGELEGIFIASDSEIEGIIGRHVYFGEILGKHSDIQCTIEIEDFVELTNQKC